MTAVCQGLAEQVLARKILHPDDPLLTAQAAGASKLYQARATGGGSCGRAPATSPPCTRSAAPRPLVVGRRKAA